MACTQTVGAFVGGVVTDVVWRKVTRRYTDDDEDGGEASKMPRVPFVGRLRL